MAKRTVVKEEKASEVVAKEEEPRFPWQEVHDELNILETCGMAIETLESEYFTDTSRPIGCTFDNSLKRLKALIKEISDHSQLDPSLREK